MDRKDCNLCLSLARAKFNKWTKFDLPFRNLCEKHSKLVQNSPDLLKINEQAERIIKPIPKLHFGKNGYGKIRFKSYLKDLLGVRPLNWWVNEDFGNPYLELKNMLGVNTGNDMTSLLKLFGSIETIVFLEIFKNIQNLDKVLVSQVKKLKSEILEKQIAIQNLTYKKGVGWFYKEQKISVHQLDAFLVYWIWKGNNYHT